MTVIAQIGAPNAWTYAARVAAGIVLMLWLRPWKHYTFSCSPSDWAWALLAGVLVLLAWIGLEMPIAGRFPAVQEFYLRWLVMPLGGVPEPVTFSPYAPAVCGWPLTLVRLAGSAFVIAVIEEFFWRGFLYRWLIDRQFLKVGLGEFELQAFALAVLFFGVEHQRWFAGIIAGVVYGGLILWRKTIWPAVIAHVVTNFLLGLYVIGAEQYTYW